MIAQVYKKYKNKIILATVAVVSCFVMSADSFTTATNLPAVTMVEDNNFSTYNPHDAISLDTLFATAATYDDELKIPENKQKLSIVMEKNYTAKKSHVEKTAPTISQVKDADTAIRFIAGGSYSINNKVKGFVDVIHTNSNMGVNFGVSLAF